MCGLIALLFFGFSGIFGIGFLSGSQVGTVDVTSVPLMMTETTPTPTFVPTDVAIELPAVEALSAGTPVPTAEGAEALSCESVYTSEEDAAFVADYPDDTFDDQWAFTPGTDTLKAIGAWTNNELSAVAYMELLQFDCGVPPTAMEDYLNPDTFPIFFQNYDSYTWTEVCNSVFETLFTFDLVFYEQPYLARYWFEQVSPTRLALFSVTLPASEAKGMDRIGAQLFPNLPSCPVMNGVG